MIDITAFDDSYYVEASDVNGEVYVRVSDIHAFKRMKNNWAIITSSCTFFTKSFDITVYKLYIDPFDEDNDTLKFEEVVTNKFKEAPNTITI